MEPVQVGEELVLGRHDEGEVRLATSKLASAAATLGLPCGPPYEIPLVLQDRNLDVDEATGQFTGRLLYKLAAPGAEFFGPYSDRLTPTAVSAAARTA